MVYCARIATGALSVLLYGSGRGYAVCITRWLERGCWGMAQGAVHLLAAGGGFHSPVQFDLWS